MIDLHDSHSNGFSFTQHQTLHISSASICTKSRRNLFEHIHMGKVAARFGGQDRNGRTSQVTEPTLSVISEWNKRRTSTQANVQLELHNLVLDHSW